MLRDKTHPLTDAAISALAMIKDRALPSQQFNPGIVNRLRRGELARIVQLPSPYPTHRRKNTVRLIGHLEITRAGLVALNEAVLSRKCKPREGEFCGARRRAEGKCWQCARPIAECDCPNVTHARR